MFTMSYWDGWEYQKYAPAKLLSLAPVIEKTRGFFKFSATRNTYTMKKEMTNPLKEIRSINFDHEIVLFKIN